MRAEARLGGRKRPHGKRGHRGAKADMGCCAAAPWRARKAKGLKATRGLPVNLGQGVTPPTLACAWRLGGKWRRAAVEWWR